MDRGKGITSLGAELTALSPGLLKNNARMESFISDELRRAQQLLDQAEKYRPSSQPSRMFDSHHSELQSFLSNMYSHIDSGKSGVICPQSRLEITTDLGDAERMEHKTPVKDGKGPSALTSESEVTALSAVQNLSPSSTEHAVNSAIARALASIGMDPSSYYSDVHASSTSANVSAHNKGIFTTYAYSREQLDRSIYSSSTASTPISSTTTEKQPNSLPPSEKSPNAAKVNLEALLSPLATELEKYPPQVLPSTSDIPDFLRQYASDSEQTLPSSDQDLFIAKLLAKKRSEQQGDDDDEIGHLHDQQVSLPVGESPAGYDPRSRHAIPDDKLPSTWFEQQVDKVLSQLVLSTSAVERPGIESKTTPTMDTAPSEAILDKHDVKLSDTSSDQMRTDHSMQLPNDGSGGFNQEPKRKAYRRSIDDLLREEEERFKASHPFNPKVGKRISSRSVSSSRDRSTSPKSTGSTARGRSISKRIAQLQQLKVASWKEREETKREQELRELQKYPFQPNVRRSRSLQRKASPRTRSQSAHSEGSAYWKTNENEDVVLYDLLSTRPTPQPKGHIIRQTPAALPFSDLSNAANFSHSLAHAYLNTPIQRATGLTSAEEIDANPPESHAEKKGEKGAVSNGKIPDVASRLYLDHQRREISRVKAKALQELRTVSQYRFQPKINPTSKAIVEEKQKHEFAGGRGQVLKSRQRPLHERVGDIQREKQENLQRLRLQQMAEGPESECVFVPSINPLSYKIAIEKAKSEGLPVAVYSDLEDELETKCGHGECYDEGHCLYMEESEGRGRSSRRGSVSRSEKKAVQEAIHPSVAATARLSKYAQELEQKQRNARRQREMEEMSKYQFRPKINPRSKSIAESYLQRAKSVVQSRDARGAASSESPSRLKTDGFSSSGKEGSHTSLEDQFLERQKVLQALRDKKKYDRMHKVVQETHQKYTFAPDIGNADEVLAFTRPSLVHETPEQRVARLAAEGKKRRHWQEAKKREYLSQFSFKPQVNELSRALGRTSTVEQLYSNEEGRRRQEELKNAAAAEFAQAHPFQPKLSTSRRRTTSVTRSSRDSSKGASSDDASAHMSHSASKMSDRIAAYIAKKELAVETARHRAEYEELSACTFKPDVSESLQRYEQMKKHTEATGGVVVVRGLGRHLELKELQRRIDEERQLREIEAFSVKHVPEYWRDPLGYKAKRVQMNPDASESEGENSPTLHGGPEPPVRGISKPLIREESPSMKSELKKPEPKKFSLSQQRQMLKRLLEAGLDS